MISTFIDYSVKIQGLCHDMSSPFLHLSRALQPYFINLVQQHYFISEPRIQKILFIISLVDCCSPQLSGEVIHEANWKVLTPDLLHYFIQVPPTLLPMIASCCTSLWSRKIFHCCLSLEFPAKITRSKSCDAHKRNYPNLFYLQTVFASFDLHGVVCTLVWSG